MKTIVHNWKSKIRCIWLHPNISELFTFFMWDRKEVIDFRMSKRTINLAELKYFPCIWSWIFISEILTNLSWFCVHLLGTNPCSQITTWTSWEMICAALKWTLAVRRWGGVIQKGQTPSQQTKLHKYPKNLLEKKTQCKCCFLSQGPGLRLSFEYNYTRLASRLRRSARSEIMTWGKWFFQGIF